MAKKRAKKERVKIAVIGAGIWGENHAMAFSTYPLVEVSCIGDLNAKRAKALAEKIGCDYTTKLSEIAASDVDAVSIATPDYAHRDPAIQMIKAGKHVLIEKPLTTDVAEAKEIVAAANKAKVKLMVDFQLRWHPNYMGAKATFESGAAGKPIMGYARLSDTIHVPTEMLSWGARSGPEWFLFPHTMDIVRWIIQEEPQEVYARGRKEVLAGMGIDCYDAVQAMVQFDKAFVTFETCWIIPNSFPTVVDNRLTLYGSKGAVEINYDPSIWIATDRFHHPFSSHAITRYGKPFAHYYESIRYFADCVANDITPEPSGQDGLVATAMIVASVKSLAEGRAVKMAEVLGS